MSTENVTWMKFYPQDWLADPGLRMCSPAARGVWMDLIAVMHDASPYGHLLVGEAAPTNAALARLAGLSVQALVKLLRELEANNVLARTPDGIIYSRRMVRDEAARAEGRFHASKAKASPPPPPPEGEAPPTPPTGEGATGGGSPPTPTGEPPLSRARERPETRGQRYSEPNGSDASVVVAGPFEPMPDARTALFREGLARTRRLTGKPDGPARAMLGRWLRDAGDDCAMLAAVLHEAEATRAADPAAWISAAISRRMGTRAPPPRDDASARRVAAFRAAAEEAGVTIDQQGFILQ
ncbi:MAG TPA: hypothetical protein VGN96_00030 [Roseococcus sp.]|jgi:hypothetical protein|nr:hypothetical protein [Roseococcus sp.]